MSFFRLAIRFPIIFFGEAVLVPYLTADRPRNLLFENCDPQDGSYFTRSDTNPRYISEAWP